MKKALKVNISGFVFTIDEDAFERLEDYLDLIKSRFTNDEEGKEIMSDIESRVAELFQEKLTETKQVINVEDVNAVINVMGKPEDYLTADDEAEEVTASIPKSERRKNRRMYRDTDHRVLGGVCSGMANYFNIDPVIVRLIFVFAFFVIGPGNVFVYLVMLFAVPPARTSAQKLEMRGERVTVSNIKRTVKEEYNTVKDNFDSYRKSEDTQNTFDRFMHLMVVSGSFIVRLFVIFFAIVVIFTGIGLLIALIGGYFFHTMSFGPDNFHDHVFSIPYILHNFVSSSTVTIGSIALFLLILLPVIGLIYAGLKLIFKFKTNDRFIGYSAFSIWIIALILLIFVAANEARNYSVQGSNNETVELKSFKTDTLYIDGTTKPESDDNIDNRDLKVDFDNLQIENINGKDVVFATPRITIEKSKSNQFEMVLKRRSRGEDKNEAVRFAKNILYNYKQTDSLITFDRFFHLPENQRWRIQELDIIIKVPVGKFLYMKDNIRNNIYDIKNSDEYWDGDMLEKLWVMRADGLTLVNRPKHDFEKGDGKDDEKLDDMKKELDDSKK